MREPVTTSGRCIHCDNGKRVYRWQVRNKRGRRLKIAYCRTCRRKLQQTTHLLKNAVFIDDTDPIFSTYSLDVEP